MTPRRRGVDACFRPTERLWRILPPRRGVRAATALEQRLDAAARKDWPSAGSGQSTPRDHDQRYQRTLRFQPPFSDHALVGHPLPLSSVDAHRASPAREAFSREPTGLQGAADSPRLQSEVSM